MSRRLRSALVVSALLASGGAPLLASAGAATLPADYPAAGCFTITDPKGDASFEAKSQLPNDPDLDLLGVALETTSTSLKAYASLDHLAAGPQYGDGHRFSFTFTFNGHVFTASGSAYGKSSPQIRDGLANSGQVAHVTQLSVDSPSVPVPDAGFKDSGLKVTFDTTNSWVVFDLPLADVAKYGGKALDGTITAVAVSSSHDGYARSFPDDTTIKDNGTTATDKWTVGDNACFAPPAGVLSLLGTHTVQYGDVAQVGAVLTNKDGAPLAGKTVTFAVGSVSTTATTGPDGKAIAALNPGSVAGTYSLITSFAGDSSAGKVSTTVPFTVTEEKTKLTLTVAKSGSARTVTARLLDDDNHAVAGQTVAWYVNGKKVASGVTSAAGTVVLKTAKPTQTVKADFVEVPGKYLPSSAQQKV